MSTLPGPAATYISILSLLALGLSVVLVSPAATPGPKAVMLAVTCAALMTLTWLRPLPRGFKRKLYLDDSVLVATVLMFKPGVVMLIAGIGTILAHILRREDWVQSVFNASQIMLKAGAGAAVLAAFGAELDAGLVAVAGPVLVAGFVMFVVNHSLVATMVALASSESLLHVWRESAREVSHVEVIEYAAQVGLGAIVAALATVVPWLLLLLLLPASLVYRVLERMNERRGRAAFDSTS
jgi:uncharacterized membrane protein